MLTIGLTGGIGSGKSTVANIFKSFGIPIIDTDSIAHQLTLPGTTTLRTIVDNFGSEILHSDLTLNRQLLAKIIFNNPERKKKLEKILHPAIYEQVAFRLSKLQRQPYVLVVVPLLIETPFKKLVNKILVVDTSEQNQILRTEARDGKTKKEIQNIIQEQSPREIRLQYADDIIYNSGSLDELQKAVTELHEKYTLLAKQ